MTFLIFLLLLAVALLGGNLLVAAGQWVERREDVHGAKTTRPPADVLTDCDPDWDWQFDRIVRGEL